MSTGQASPPAVAVDGVSKTFEIPREHVHTLKERVLHPLRSSGHDAIRALRDVTLAVQPGEFFGIVGRNGSGKSTLLKCLAGIYATDRGRIYVNGRMSTFIELGVGFNPDLAAYDNVMLNATMLGLSPREGRRRYDRVIDFAELHDYTDLKLKNYSSGMLVRLAFSVMVQVDADILLIDEVLAVGDAAFQQKCFDEFARIRKDGTTVLLVTHDMSSVARFCDRAVLLERGAVVEMGDPQQVGMRYLELNFSQEARARAAADAGDEAGHIARRSPDPGSPFTASVNPHGPTAQVIEAWLEDGDGQRSGVFPTGTRCTVALRLGVLDDVADAFVGISLLTAQRLKVLDASNHRVLEPGRRGFAAGDEPVVRFTFDAHLGPGRYYVDAAIARGDEGEHWIDHREQLLSFMVTGVDVGDALTTLPYEVAVDAADGLPARPPHEVAG